MHTSSPLTPQTAFPGIREKSEPVALMSKPQHTVPYTATWDTTLLCIGKSDPLRMCTTANLDTTCYPLSNHGICLNTCFSETGVREYKTHPWESTLLPMGE